MFGLTGFEIYWRPLVIVEEKLKLRFDTDCTLGFPGSFEKYSEAHWAGFYDLTITLREKIVYNFMAARFSSNTQRFEITSLIVSEAQPMSKSSMRKNSRGGCLS